MGVTYIDEKKVNSSVKNIENQYSTSIKNISVDMSKLDLTGAVDSFKKLTDVLNNASFKTFIDNMVSLEEIFTSFQKKVSGATGSVTKFTNAVPAKEPTTVITNVEVSVGDVDATMSAVDSSVSSAAGSVDSAAQSIGTAAQSIGTAFQSAGTAALDFGNGIAAAGGGISSVLGSASGLLTSIAGLGQGLIDMATGCAMLVPLLPQLGASFMQMLVNIQGLMAYLAPLAIFVLTMGLFALMGPGLMAAGLGMQNIGLGLVSMTEGLTALLAFMPLFIESLVGITDNIGGIILFVLLAAAVLVMAIALQKMNEPFGIFKDNLTSITELMSVGFVAAFAVFAVLMVGMSFFMNKVATGIKQVSDAMAKQCAKLAVLNPLLATFAVLSNPIKGAITVALAIASGILVKALLPGMATGGVVSSPTVAMVGEGRYPEAVVPLGDSPQFTSMKTEIANAVLAGITAMDRAGGRPSQKGEVVLNLDGERFARAILPRLTEEQKRRGYQFAIKEG